MQISRRDALVGAGAIAAAPLLTSGAVEAAAPVADKQAPSFYRYKVGDVLVTVVSDGVNTFPLGDSFVVNAKKDEVNAALEKAFMPKDKVSIYFAPLVLNIGDNLAAAGFDPKAVDTVVISHFHTDHVNGLLTEEGMPAFPNAEVLVPAAEWKFWMD